MVKILIALLLIGLSLVHSTEFLNDEEYQRIVELRPLAVEFSKYYRNITQADLDLFTNRLPDQEDLQCLADMAQLMAALSTRKMWALKMFDSWGTLPKGFLYGNTIDMGNYDECITINQVISDDYNLRGKYCFAVLPIASHGIYIRSAVCFPSSCSATHIDAFMGQLLKKLLNVTTTPFRVSEDSCRTLEREPEDGLFIFTIVVLALLAAAVVLTTCYDFLCCKDQTLLPSVVKIFSARANSRELFRIVQPKSNPNVIDCLYGMRCMSLIWVIFGHQYLFALLAPNINQFRLKWWFEKPYTSFVLHGVFSVDTFFFLSGMLLVVIALRSLEKSNGKLNILMMYLHRYLRLTPVVALAILLYMKILPLFGDGPMYENVKFDDYNHCKRTWFWTLLYLQNYATPDLCINHSWYLAVDMQLYFISPIFLLALYKWGKKAAAGIFVFMLLLSACLFATMMTEKYPVYLQNGVTPDEAQRKLYYATHTHAAPWLIGVLFGYFLHLNRNKSLKLNHISVWIGWMVALALIFASIFSLLPYADWRNPTLPMLNQAFYYTFTRIAWPLSLCWIVFACMRGYGGLANSFLSSPLWQPLSKLSYNAYIFHIFIQQINGRRMRTNTFFSDYDVMLIFWGGFGFTILLSYAIYILLEAPFGVLESMLMPNRRAPSKAKVAEDLPSNATAEIRKETLPTQIETESETQLPTSTN
ncbi:nose resistant to fluoxetine protein 6-like [Drosophila sulfurigaster albostrigata]|uniref:nose resistant to fluoxetine protein 6-like n=1 Tax=Drosophila sulfurigaster albostrigata TaxID=89887 RepID=UPI002D21AAFD|nr:nose resistant to fluoxetine protein 6-like [Drosophila sulfurigaster albostrigata]